MSDTIVPEVKLDNLQAELQSYTAKPVGGSNVIELKIHVPVSFRIDWDALSKLLRQSSRLTLVSDQAPLPMKPPSAAGGDSSVADGQLAITDINADAQPDGPEPTKYSLLLLELPTEEKQLKAAKKWLRKFTGLKAADLDVELEALAAGAGYLVIEGGNEPYVIESKLEMERLGMVVTMHAWATNGDPVEAPAAANPLDALFNPPAAKVAIDQLVVGSQWLLKGIGTQVRIFNVVGEKVYFHSLYALYSSLPAWVFAAAVTPAESLADLEAADLAKWENAEVKPVMLDPETEARMQEPWLMPVVELPIGATVEYHGKVWEIAGVSILDGKPLADLERVDEAGEALRGDVLIAELVEPLALKDLSPLVFHALNETQQEAQEGASNSPDAQTQHEAPDLSPEAEQGGSDEGLDPTPSTDTDSEPASDGGERVMQKTAKTGTCSACGCVFSSFYHEDEKCSDCQSEKDALVGRYFMGANGVIFKVLHIQHGVLFTQDEGAAEAEADSVSELLQAIAAGRVKPANEAQRELWDKTTTQDPEFEERGMSTSDEQDAA